VEKRRIDEIISGMFGNVHIREHSAKVLGRQMGKWVLTQCDREETRKGRIEWSILHNLVNKLEYYGEK
jgi:hypothetical protein